MQIRPIPDYREGVAADSIGGRLEDGQGNRGRNGRVDCIPALQHHTKARLRGKRLRGRYDVLREEGAAKGRIFLGHTTSVNPSAFGLQVGLLHLIWI